MTAGQIFSKWLANLNQVHDRGVDSDHFCENDKTLGLPNICECKILYIDEAADPQFTRINSAYT
jgi:hypothetical protein